MPPSRRALNSFVTPLTAIVLALVAGGIVMVLDKGTIAAPFSSYGALLVGAFGTPYDVSETLVSATPLIFAGLGVAFAFRGGLFNIGGEGQLYMGALASTYVGYALHWPGWIRRNRELRKPTLGTPHCSLSASSRGLAACYA